MFHLLPEAFKGIKQIGVIGWGSQVNILSFFVNFSLRVICLKSEVLDLYKLALFVCKTCTHHLCHYMTFAS